MTSPKQIADGLRLTQPEIVVTGTPSTIVDLSGIYILIVNCAYLKEQSQ